MGRRERQMKKKLRGLSIASAFLLASPAAATDVSFAGKTIKLYAGSGAGGVYDIFCRLAARHLGKHLPGEPSIVVVDMPGAGSITAANYIFNVAPKDGTAMGLMSPSVKVLEAFQGARFEAAKFNWIGRIISTTNVTFTYGASKIKTVEDARRTSVKIAATAPSSPLSFHSRALNVAGGTKFNMIHGYIDANAAILAAERGEVEGVTVSWNSLKSMRPHWLRDKQVNILVQYTPTAHSELKDVPTAPSLATSAENRALIDVFMSAAVVGLALMAPPQTPAENVETLRKGFRAMIADPAFKAEGAKLDPDMDSLDGWALQKAVEETSKLPADILKRAKDIATGK